MPLFTIVLDYLGGTYIAQARGIDPEAAVASWARSYARELAVPGVSEAELRDAFERAEPVEVESVQSVWCCSALIQDELATLHMVQTAE